MKLKRFLTGVLSAVMALSVCALPAAAADEGATTTAPSTSTIDTGKKGSITIHKYLVEGNVTGSSNYGEKLTDGPAYEAAKDVGFSIYQVMTAEELVAYYNGKDNTEPKASDYKIDATKAKVTKGSKEYKRFRDEQKTDATGVTTFNQLEVGLYLVVETTKPAAVTEEVEPFLVSVPMTKVGESGKDDPTQWLYDIHVYPKNSTQTGTICLKKQGLVGGGAIDNTPKDLNGVKFRLERLKEGKNVGDTDAWEIVKNGTSDVYTTDTVDSQNGIIKVEGLYPGTYRFTEVGYADSAAGVDKKYILDTAASYTFKIEATPDGQKVTKLDDSNSDYEIKGTIITVTNYAPDVDKQVVNRTDGKTYQEAADYAVGDKIPYRIAVTIPTNIAKLKTFYLTDTPENLDDDTSTINFYKNPECTAQIVDKTSLLKNSITVYPADTAKGSGFKIDFDPKKLTSYAGKTIYITYDATLNKGADTTTAGNHNKVDLTYSNKVKPDGADEVADTDHNHIEDTAVVYTFQIDIFKTDGSKKALDDVEFDLYEEVTKGTVGTLTEEKAKALGFTNTSVAYKKVDHGVTANGGKLTFTGLSNSKAAMSNASRYWLVETKTKEGYNLLGAPVEAKLDIVYKTTWAEKNEFKDGVLVKHSHDASTETFTKPSDENAKTNGGKQSGTKGQGTRGEDVIYGSLRTEIINKKGFQLPVTGGFGTLLFSGIGVLLVLAGVAVLFSMKKKNDRA